MQILFFIITDIIHVIKIILICDLFIMFSKRGAKYRYSSYIFILFMMIGVSLGIYLWDNDIIEIVIYCAAVSLMLCMLYKEKTIKIIISAIWMILILAMLDSMSVILVDLVANMVEYSNEDVYRFIAGIISFIFVFSLGKIFNRKYKDGIKGIGFINLLSFTALAMIDTFVVMVIATITLKEEHGNQRFIYSIAFVFVILGIFLQLAAVILLFVQRNVYKEKKQVTEKYLNEQKNYYEYLENREKETKKFRHDIRNHMQMISTLARERKYEEFDSYIEKIDMKIESIGNVVTVHNGIVDAILNQYYSKAVQNNIVMEVAGRFPEESNVDAYDLCTIFSNLLSNAFEAAVNAKEKNILVECRYTEKNIIIVVKNMFNDVGQFDDNKIKTDKTDVNYHGFGLVNIRETIDKYNGVMDIEIKDQEFTLKILLNCMGKVKNENSNNR